MNRVDVLLLCEIVQWADKHHLSLHVEPDAGAWSVSVFDGLGSTVSSSVDECLTQVLSHTVHRIREYAIDHLAKRNLEMDRRRKPPKRVSNN